jgi:xanthine dehydrogenase accessory factor
VRATLGGVLRGLLHDMPVQANVKVADIDPRGEQRFCWTISDKALAVAGGVIEAVFSMREAWKSR